MDLIGSSFLPGDPRLINQIVYELKSQGIFDQFRKECIADVDTKPAYQNLSQRVEGSVMNFLNKQKFTENINKNQLREHLRKNITESGFLESGVERIVDQVVNPKINSVFLPKVEDVVYRFLGIERPSQDVQQPETKPHVEDLLPDDLEAISPESAHDHSINSTEGRSNEAVDERKDALNGAVAKAEDEGPSFESLDASKVSLQEENSEDSHISATSGLSQNSRKNNDIDMPSQIEAVQDVSLHNDSNLSVKTSEENTKMEVSENTTLSSGSDNIMEKISEKIEPVKLQPIGDGANVGVSSEPVVDTTEGRSEKIPHEENTFDGKKPDNSKRSHDRHKASKTDSHRREPKDKRERSKSESKSKDHKEKTSSKHSSSSKDKESANKKEATEETKKDDKDRKEKSSSSKSKSSRGRSEKRDISKEKNEKDKEKTHKDKNRHNKEKSNVDKDGRNEKPKSSKDKEKPDKSKLEKDQSEKSKPTKSSKEKPSSSSKTESKDKASSSKEKGPTSNQDRTSSRSSKDKPKSGSSTQDKDRKIDESKSKSTDKHKKRDKSSSSSNEKYSMPSRKDKDRKVSDDHYSFKDKKGTRRSTDRDSNDGASKMSRNGSLTEGGSNSYKGSSKESSEAFSSGGGESSNSESVEHKPAGDGTATLCNVEVPPIKYLKPKFASNIHEAMKLMKIRKQLAKLERKNQLALTAVSMEEKIEPESQDKSFGSQETDKTSQELHDQLPDNSSKELDSPLKNILELQMHLEKQVEEGQRAVIEDIPTLKSQDISLESFAALEARLALEMSTVNDRPYGYGDDEDEDTHYLSLTTSPAKQRKLSEKQEIYHSLFEESAPNSREAATDQNAVESNSSSNDISFQPSKMRTFILDQNSDEEIELAAGGQSKSRVRDANPILRTVLLTPDFRGFSSEDREDGVSPKLAQLCEQIRHNICKMERKAEYLKSDNKSAELISNSEYGLCSSIKHMNGKKLIIHIDKTELDSKKLPLKAKEVTSLNGVVNFQQNGRKSGSNEEGALKISSRSPAESSNSQINEWENDDIPCCFFDKPATSHISVLNRQIEQLEKQLRQIENPTSAFKKQGLKRPFQEAERSIGSKSVAKRGRLNHVVLEQNTYDTNLPPHQDFNLPLSPAESEKSGEQKKDEPAPVKPRKSARGSTSQRYSTDDLYKPRPALGCSGSRRKGNRGDSLEQS